MHTHTQTCAHRDTLTTQTNTFSRTVALAHKPHLPHIQTHKITNTSICRHTPACTHTCMRKHAYSAYIHTHANAYMHTHTFMHECAHTHAHTHTLIHTSHTHTHAYTYKHTQTGVYNAHGNGVYTGEFCAGICRIAWVLYIYIYIFIHMNIYILVYVHTNLILIRKNTHIYIQMCVLI